MKTAIQGFLSLSCAVFFFALNSPGSTAAPLSVWLECPHDVTVNCTEDLSNLDKWGKAWLWENYIKKDAPNADLKRKAYTAVAAKVARVAYGVVKHQTNYRCYFESVIPSGGIASERP